MSTTRIKRYAVALLVVQIVILGLLENPLQAQQEATPGDGFQGIWYSIGHNLGGHPNKYGGGFATYPHQSSPIAVYSSEANRTYFTVLLDIAEGPARNIGHALSYYDHATGLVARPQVWVNKGTHDAHDSSVLMLDDEGYIYMFSSTHGETRQAQISKSANPHDISSFHSLLDVDSPEDLATFGNNLPHPIDDERPRFSYGSAWHVPHAEEEKILLLHSRYYYNQRDLYSTTSFDADVWTERKPISRIEIGQYQTSWIKPDGASVGTIFNVHPDGKGSDYRTDLYYLETHNQADTWQTIDGVTLVNNSGANQDPLLARPKAPSDGKALVYNASPDERVYLKDVNYAADGSPVILFLTAPTHIPGEYGSPGPDRFLKTAHWSGADWVVNDFMSTDHNYDHGSLYVEEDGSWSVIGPYLEGPRAYGTGGEVGKWTSLNQGTSWTLERELTTNSANNHTFVRRPLDAHDDFYALWADGNAWNASDVNLFFSNNQGDVYQLPFEMTSDFAAPIRYNEDQTPPVQFAIAGALHDATVNGLVESITIVRNGETRKYLQSELIPAMLSSFRAHGDVGSNEIDLVAPATGGAPHPNLRHRILGDGLADTAFVNLESWSVYFEHDVFNQPGPDLILLDWGSEDTVDITIGRRVVDDLSPVSSSLFGEQLINRLKLQSDQTFINSLGELMDATFQAQSITTATTSAFAIDLSDFGYAENAVMPAGTHIIFSDGQGVDPSEIYALPIDAVRGDFNYDGVVDSRDYTLWRDRYGQGYSMADLANLQANYRRTLTSVGSTSYVVAVPAPATSMLGLLACFTTVVSSAYRDVK